MLTIHRPLVGAFAIVIGLWASAAPAVVSRSPLVGVWEMVSLEVPGENGELRAVPHSGQIIFTDNGHMAVQAADPDPDAAATPYTRLGYEAFYGPVRIDDAAGTFTATITSALVRDLVGTTLVRRVAITGDRMVLTSPDQAERFRVTYRRL